MLDRNTMRVYHVPDIPERVGGVAPALRLAGSVDDKAGAEEEVQARP